MKYLILLILIPVCLHAQERFSDRYGIVGTFGLNTHFADFKRLPDCPSCSPGYFDGSGNGLNAGIVYEYALYPGYFLSSKLLYRTISGTFTSTEKTTVIVAGIPTPGEFEHTLNTTLATLGIEPSIKMRIFDNFHGGLGVNVSYLTTKSYRQVEKITQPTDYGTFANPDGSNSFSRERNKFSGTLQSANSLFIAPVASLSYSAPLNQQETLFLEPVVSYYLGFSNIVDDASVQKWTVNSLSFGLSLMYSPARSVGKPSLEKVEWHIDTLLLAREGAMPGVVVGQNSSITTKTEELDSVVMTTRSISRTDTLFTSNPLSLQATMTAVGVSASGTEVANPTFVIEEFVSNRLDPLLNYMFFDQESSTIPVRYKRLSKDSARSFTVNSLYRDSTMELYHNILNIIGKRMTENPSASITLVGCNADVEAEKGNLALSEERAVTVRKYLVETWDIPERRINIRKQGLPEQASTPKNEPEKMAENRRVEIYSDNPKIIEPVFIEKIDRSANPPTVRFLLSATPETRLAQWSVTSYQESAPSVKFRQTGSGSLPRSIDWKLSENQNITPQFEEMLKSKLYFRTVGGNTDSVPGNDLKIDIQSIQKKRKEMLGDFEREKFSLILFDFNKTSIDGNNAKVLQFISSRIKKESGITITGYADKTGDADYLRALSLRRATATRSALQRPDAVTEGIGSDILLYNNELPEGRFYCRTVVIDVKTPTVR